MDLNQPENSARDEPESILQLLRDILQDAKTLSTKELLAAKLEIKQEIAEAGQAAASLAIGGFILLIGAILLSLMLVFLLVTYAGWPLWVSLGFFGLAFSAIGALMLWSGKRKVQGVEPFPAEAVKSAREDVRYLKEKAS